MGSPQALVVEHLVKSALQSIVWLMGSPQAVVPTSIVHPVVHTVVYLTLLASVVLVEVRSVIVIVEVTCHSSRGERIIRITIVPIHRVNSSKGASTRSSINKGKKERGKGGKEEKHRGCQDLKTLVEVNQAIKA